MKNHKILVECGIFIPVWIIGKTTTLLTMLEEKNTFLAPQNTMNLTFSLYILKENAMDGYLLIINKLGTAFGT